MYKGYDFRNLTKLYKERTMTKGAILDTNASVQDATDYMVKNNRVAAFGKIKDCIKNLELGDFVFLYKKGVGIIAAAKITSALKADDDNTCYMDVEFLLTPEQAKPLTAAQVKTLLGHGFFWAKTLKAPYLTVQESEVLLAALKAS